MKTAEELFNGNSLPYTNSTGRFMIFHDLKLALTEHDKEIIKLFEDIDVYTGVEIKQIIERELNDNSNIKD